MGRRHDSLEAVIVETTMNQAPMTPKIRTNFGLAKNDVE
jgi:hypothetical protein